MDMQTILIADDERGEREKVKSLLAQGGYKFNTVEAGNGIEVLELVKVHKQPKDDKSVRSDVERVKAYIYKHYSEQLSVELLASKVFLSAGYMSYIFKKETGVGISQFITSYRMEMAKRLITDTNMKIVQISSEVGFNNSAYFGKSFKEYYGCSPEQYRKGYEEFEKNA
jgi:two-component system response regulator YesN